MRALLLLLGFFMLFGCIKEKQEIAHPNVLFISIDDLNDWIEPLAGNPQALTPSLARFADEAVNFTRNYCASPGCNPSRGAILTGIHTYRSGLYSNYQDWRLIPKLTAGNTLNQHFKSNGYYTAGAGKIYHYAQVDSSGWDDYFPSKTKPMPPDNFPDTVPAAMPRFTYMYNMFDWAGLPIDDEETGDFQSVNYITDQLKRNHDKPFFLACGIYRPHLPWYVPQKYFDLFPIENVQLPKRLENDTADLGDYAKQELVIRGGNYHKHVVKAGLWKQAIQGYLASVAFADAMVGRLLEALSKSAYADNTIVVIWSDHGWQLGQKNHWRKFALWENVNRSVLMIKVPVNTAALPSGSIPGKAASLTSLLDVYPTLIELCNLPPRRDLDGQSLLPILRAPGQRIERPIITTYDYGSYSVRFNEWHYIRYIDDSEELYNLESDPEEWNNLASDSQFNSTKKQLAGFIPTDPEPLPEASLLPLLEHHIPPIKSREHYFSTERKEWMKRFILPD
ncbi:sulfatase [Oscillatoria amoena NRMC-F 0135]|nr:sulfatase [Oscillatoria amoena NRMC-F 0135]